MVGGLRHGTAPQAHLSMTGSSSELAPTKKTDSSSLAHALNRWLSPWIQCWSRTEPVIASLPSWSFFGTAWIHQSHLRLLCSNATSMSFLTWEDYCSVCFLWLVMSGAEIQLCCQKTCSRDRFIRLITSGPRFWVTGTEVRCQEKTR